MNLFLDSWKETRVKGKRRMTYELNIRDKSSNKYLIRQSSFQNLIFNYKIKAAMKKLCDTSFNENLWLLVDSNTKD